MRSRKEIEEDCKELPIDMNGIVEELLLDIRDLLEKVSNKLDGVAGGIAGVQEAIAGDPIDKPY